MRIQPATMLSRRLGALSARRRWFLAVSAAVVVALVGALAGPAVVSALSRQDPSGYPAQDRLGTVLLVPGYGGGTGSLDVLAARLRAAGRQAMVVQLPDGGVGDLNAQASVLDGYVSTALRSSPSVDLIGYSAGGVVVRLWVEGHDGAAKARRVITLGSPFHGTTVAGAGAAIGAAACPAACQQLVPGSSLLTQLDASAPVAGHPPWLSVWTVQDQTVVPPTSAVLPDAVAVDVAVQSVCSDEQVSHSQLPTDPAVVGMVLSALGTAPLAAPAPSQCSALLALSR